MRRMADVDGQLVDAFVGRPFGTWDHARIWELRRAMRVLRGRWPRVYRELFYVDRLDELEYSFLVPQHQSRVFQSTSS